jgi:DUF1365 family protein
MYVMTRPFPRDPKPNPGPATYPRFVIVIDIDGVLADATHREHHLEGSRDWAAFFDAAEDDLPIEQGRRRLEAALAADSVTLLTGRPERLRALTEAWLAAHAFPSVPVMMRPDRDRRPARIFKLQALSALGGPEAVRLVLDDDESVVEAARSAGYEAETFIRG